LVEKVTDKKYLITDAWHRDIFGLISFVSIVATKWLQAFLVKIRTMQTVQLNGKYKEGLGRMNTGRSNHGLHQIADKSGSR